VSKPLSKKVLLKEAAFWGGMKKAVKESPGKICRK
jgi:hypothetical protein